VFSHLEDIDVDWLRGNHVRLYYFGLGFIQLKIDERYRLHFYTPELPAFNEDIHNHRYNFYSRILKGSLINHYYRVTEGDTHLIKNESCNPQIAAPVLDQPCGVVETASTLYATGSAYHIKHEQYHTVEAPEPCITLLSREAYAKDFAQVIVPKDGGGACPFSQKIEQERLWEIIGSMLV